MEKECGPSQPVIRGSRIQLVFDALNSLQTRTQHMFSVALETWTRIKFLPFQFVRPRNCAVTPKDGLRTESVAISAKVKITALRMMPRRFPMTPIQARPGLSVTRPLSAEPGTLTTEFTGRKERPGLLRMQSKARGEGLTGRKGLTGARQERRGRNGEPELLTAKIWKQETDRSVQDIEKQFGPTM
jgi:hypothetical protein